MITLHGKSLLLAVSGGMVLSALSACNSTGFVAAPVSAALPLVDPAPPLAAAPGVGNTNPPGCTIGTTKKPIRIMFMVDNSGSTLMTDPNRNYRVQTLQKFISDYGMNTYLSYNFAYFQATTASAYDMMTGKFITDTAPNPVGSSAQLSTALLAYENVTINSNALTPYKAAFKSLGDTVIADETAGNKQDYAVVFMSDGQPTDISGIDNLKGLVTSLRATATKNGSVLTMNSVYFGDEQDTASIANLKAMSTEGAGQFVDTNLLGKGGLVINNIVNVPGANCQ